MSSALKTVKGVKDAVADFPTKTATVNATGKLCKESGQEPLFSALKTAGYGGELKVVKKSK